MCIYICIRIYKLEYISFCRRRVDRDQQYGCLTETHQPQVLLGVDKAFLFALFSGGPHWGSIPALVEILRLWAQAVCSAEIFSKLRCIKINLYPPPAMTNVHLFCLGFTSFFLSLSAQKSAMHIWNWFETHFSACWCLLHVVEKTQKSSQENRKWWRALEACNTTCNILIY